MTDLELESCEEVIDYQFKDRELLRLALTHSSSKNSDGVCNERLEFLGDAILGMVISEHLYKSLPDCDEGDLTRVKSVVVSRPVLAVSAREMGVEAYVQVGRGLGQRKLPLSVLANVFEGIVAAIYEDGGLEAAEKFILNNLRSHVQEVVQDRHQKNYKSLLQQFTQKEMAATPAYRVVSHKGPDHAKQFEVIAVVNGVEYTAGWGRSKKEAEQQAAEQTLKLLLKNDGGDQPQAEDET